MHRASTAAPAARYRAQYRAVMAAHTAPMLPPYSRARARRWPALLALVLLLCLPLLAVAQESLRGMPLLRRFSAEDYNATPSHWSLATDKEGRLFVGNAEGVLRYDGETWSLIELPGRQMGREVVAGADQNIYVASYDTFGWLRTSPEGVYFRAETALHFLSYDRRTVKHWPMGENQRPIYAQGNELYARIDGIGFSRFVDGKWVLEPGGELFKEKSLPGVINRPGWRLLIGEDGLYRADAQGIRPLSEHAGEELRGTHPYAVLTLSDDSFVVGSLHGDLFRFGPDYKLRNHVTLGSFGITALGPDHEGGVWEATAGDLLRMSLPSPWSFLGAAQGLGGSAFDFDW